jgi:hypothetical protein
MAIYWEYQDDGKTSFDDSTRIATEYDVNDELIGERSYTEDENLRADKNAVVINEQENKSTIEVNLEADLAKMQAIKDQANADLRADPSQEIKELAVAVRRLIKMQLEDFETAE